MEKTFIFHIKQRMIIFNYNELRFSSLRSIQVMTKKKAFNPFQCMTAKECPHLV